MKVRAAGTMVVLRICLCGRPLLGAEAADPGALIAAAEKANADGDKVAALKGYAEAANALRASGAPLAKIDGCTAEKDRLMVEMILEMQKQQVEVVQLQRGIAQRVVKISQTDADIQARVKKNENKIKEIETLLLDIAK
ncbi:MAG: hypothetical protein WCP22_01435 [Chlamydiota bacterium]